VIHWSRPSRLLTQDAGPYGRLYSGVIGADGSKDLIRVDSPALDYAPPTVRIGPLVPHRGMSHRASLLALLGPGGAPSLGRAWQATGATTAGHPPMRYPLAINLHRGSSAR
jgi:hypothetical protein